MAEKTKVIKEWRKKKLPINKLRGEVDSAAKADASNGREPDKSGVDANRAAHLRIADSPLRFDVGCSKWTNGPSSSK
jgi:hypothetical protein